MQSLTITRTKNICGDSEEMTKSRGIRESVLKDLKKKEPLIINDYKAGLTLNEIEQRYDVCRKSIYKMLDRNGLRRWFLLSEEEIQRIIDLNNNKVKILSISVELNRSEKTIRNAIKKYVLKDKDTW